MFANAAPSGTSEQHQPRSRLGQKDWLWGLFLVALVLMAYVRVFTAGFIWDDESHLTQNPCIIGPLGLKEIWTSARAVYYPLVLTTFWSLHKLVGLSPLPYHILNVLMHAGSAALLWRVLRQLDVRGAWLGAALWALHPVMVQSVAWVTELKNTQSCLFYLLSIFWFLNWESCSRRPMGDARASHPPSRRYDVAGSEAGTGKRGEGMKFEAAETSDRVRWWRFACALLFFVMAILSKPSTVMLPAVLALCVWWRRGRIQWRDIVTLAPFALISGLASMWTIWEQKFHSGATGLEWGQMWPERLIIAGRATWFYLGKLIWPDPLIFIYPRWEINALQPAAYLPLLAALRILCRCVLCDFPVSSARLFQRLLLPLLVCERSFPVSGEHGTVRFSRGQHYSGNRFSQMETFSPPRGLRNTPAFAWLFDVAAERDLPRLGNVIHCDIGKKSQLLDGAL